MGKYDLEKLRAKLKATHGRMADPNEFRPPQAKDGQEITYRFYVLPPLVAGDKCVDGVASASMEMFYLQNGNHWLDNKPHACPRVHNDDNECALCDLGFSMMSDISGSDKSAKEARSKIAKLLLPRTYYAVNIYFPNVESNPEEVRGRIMWLNATKQVFDKFESCVYRDNPGDDIDPQAYGVFYDEDAAYMFQMSIKKDNGFNSYVTSKFLASAKTHPIAFTKTGNKIERDGEKIKKILESRHDLFTKFSPRDPDKIAKLAAEYSAKVGETVAGGDDAEWNHDEQKPTTEAKTKSAPVKTDSKPKSVAGEHVAPTKLNVQKAPAPTPTPTADDLESAELESLLADIKDA